MQQHQLPYFSYSDGSSGGSWVSTENNSKHHVQWENNGQFHVTVANNYGPGQVPGGGGQTRVGVGQQPPQPSQPTPTNTPPGGMHGDMAKQPLPPPAGAQLGYARPMPFQRTSIPQQSQQMRSLSPRVFNIPQMVPSPMVPTLYPLQGHQVMFHNPPTRQTNYASQAIFMQPPIYSHNPQFYQQLQYSSGGPAHQSTTSQLPIAVVRTNMVPSTQQPPPHVKTEQKKRAHAIKIIDPNTNEEVSIETGTNNNNVTPTHSNDNSARETPQPDPVPLVDNSAVIAEFTAKVSASLDDELSDMVSLDNISDSETLHKQSPVVPISDRVSSTLNTASSEFIPRSSMVMQAPPPSEISIEPPRPQVTVPTVSADKDSPPVDIQRPPVVMKHPPMPSSALVTQSPLKTTKKQKSGENERQAVVISEPVQPQPEVRDNKKGPKTVQREEPVQMPKERREKPRSVTLEQPVAPIPVTVAEVEPNVPITVTAQPITAAKEVSEDLSATKPQHHNGETVEHEPSPVPATTLPPASIPVPPDSNKTSKRQSGKKSGNKMRDLNRKGTEKEGSEMDAFTTEPTIMSEEKEKTPTPANSPPPTPPPEAAEPEDKIQEDIEEKEDKLVAAKNEENTKVSALSRPEPEQEPVEEEKQPPQLTLRHSYSKDQWSPLNPEGKKKYDRDFLFNLRTMPLCVKRPDNLPDVVMGVIRDYPSIKSMNFMNNRPDISVINPVFMRSQSQKGMIPKKGSQQGSRRGNSSKVIISLSLNEDVKLKTTENAWKPNRLESDTGKSDSDRETEELLKNVRGILNKLTPQKFDKLMLKFKVLPINSEHRLMQVINLIFDKAVDEPSFSKAYAQMCMLCSKIEVVKVVNTQEKANFRKMLITRCQYEFEKNKVAELDTEKWHEEINSCSDPEKKKELQLAYEDKERKIRMKSVGNIRFIGELFKLGMLTPQIMLRCIDHLLSNPAEESLECLCKLLTTIGKELESATITSKPGQQGTPVSLNGYFQKMTELSRNKGNSSKVSSRVRFMLQDVIDLRQNKWVPRREDNNPKTIEQINKEAKREIDEMNSALNQPPPRMNRGNDRSDDRKQRNRNQNDSDGWNTVTGNSRYHNNKFPVAFEATKIQIVKNEDLDSLSLGGSQNYRFQMGGKTTEPKSSSAFAYSNTFSPLSSRGEERKPPQSIVNNRKMTPTPSIEREKERQRMIQLSKEDDGHSSRESSTQRDRPQTPVREAPSQPRREEAPRQMSEEELRRAKDKLERQSQTCIEEYLGGESPAEDVRSEVEQIFTAQNCGDFVQKALDMSLDKKPPVQKKIGLLLNALLDSNLFTPEIIVEQFANIYEIFEDLAIDIPKVWDLQADLIGPVLAAEKINFSHFKDACGPVLKTKVAADLLLPVLSFLVKEKGKGFVRYLWDSSNVNLQDFIPEEINVDDFVEKQSLKYLTGEAPKYEALSMGQAQEIILKLIQNNQPYEKILDFINTNVGDKVEDVSFIRALVAAFCEACIGPSPNYVLNKDKFKKYEKLIERFVDHKEDRELACLSSVHTLCCKLLHPQGLIFNIFTELLDDNLISSESFLKWKDDKHEQLETKGVSVYALSSFFKALEEVETDDENS